MEAHRTRESAVQKLCQHLCVCEDDIMIDDNFYFKYFTRTQAFSVQLTVNVSTVLSITVISSILCRPWCTVRTFNSLQATDLSAP